MEEPTMESANMQILISLQHIIIGIKKENVEDAVQKALEIFDQNYYVSFNVVVCLLIYSAISSLKEEESTYFKFIQTLQTKETEIIGFNPKIFELFGKYLSNKEDRYLLNIMVEQKLIDSNILPKNISREHISSNKFYASSFGNVRFGLPQDTNSDSDQNNSSVSTSMENYFNGFSYQQKLYKEASPSEIANIIRNDDVEKLQEISSQTNFPLNQNIKKTLFERSKLLRSSCISLVDYAAFYGSIKCFKYLLLNGADISQTGKFAVAGGNIEIIKLCEQNHSSFADSYQAAIEFHQNDVFYYIYENKLEKFEDNKRYFPGFVSKFFLGNTLPRDTNTSDELKRLEEELGSACVKHNNYEILLYLVKEGLEIIDYYINHAIASGNLFLVKYFLENNKIANNKILLDNFSVENVELIKYLIGIDINIKDNHEKNALILASERGNIDVVKLLLEQGGIGINENCGEVKCLQEKVLFCTTTERFRLTGFSFFNQRINKTCQSVEKQEGDTALMVASYGGHANIVKLLLEQQGINVNAKNVEGNTALIYASINGHSEVVKLLLEKEGIDIYIKNKQGYSSFMLAAEKDRCEVMKLLMEKGEIDAKDNNLDKFLLMAVQEGRTEEVKLLVEIKGIDVNIKDDSGCPLLIIAVEKTYPEIAKILVECKGIDINAKDYLGNTALSWASYYGFDELVQLLSQKLNN